MDRRGSEGVPSPPAFFRFRLRKGRFVSPTVLRRLIPAAQSLVGAGTSLSGLPQSGCFCPSVSVETSGPDGSAFSKLAALRARDNEISTSEPGGIAASVLPHGLHPERCGRFSPFQHKFSDGPLHLIKNIHPSHIVCWEIPLKSAQTASKLGALRIASCMAEAILRPHPAQNRLNRALKGRLTFAVR